VERICTDIAFLDEGVTRACGTLSDIKACYGRKEYLIETENEEDARVLTEAFPLLYEREHKTLCFEENELSPFAVMEVLAKNRIIPLRFERTEATLEALFTEVKEK